MGNEQMAKDLQAAFPDTLESAAKKISDAISGITWANIEAAAKVLEENKVAGPYYVRVHPKSILGQYLKRFEMYQRRYKNHGK
jgi:hypothetical protein